MKNLIGFKNYLNSERKSQCTIDAYTKDVEQLIKFINKQSEEINFSDIYMYKAELADKKSATVNRKLISINKFFEYMVECKLCNENPCSGVKKLKQKDETHKEFIQMEDAKKMLEYGKNSRDKAIIAVYLTTGIRVTELINLTIDDYNAGVTHIVAKGKVNRLVAFSDYCRHYVDEYLKERKECEFNNLFISNQCTPMCRRALSNTLKVIAKKADLPGDISNHTLRHTFVSHVCDNYGVKKAQDVVAHKSITTTQRYCHSTDNSLANVMLNIQI